MAATSRLTGKLASIYINTVFKLDVYNWEWEVNAEVHPCSIKGETFERYSVGVGTGRIRAQRYITTFTTMSPGVFDSIVNNAQATVVLYLIDGNNSFSKLTATGVVTRGSLSAPHAKAFEEIEVTLDGLPTYAGI